MGQSPGTGGTPPPLEAGSGRGAPPHTYPQVAAAAPAGVGGAAAFPGHLLPHLGCHCPVGTGRGPVGTGNVGSRALRARLRGQHINSAGEESRLRQENSRPLGQGKGGFQRHASHTAASPTPSPSTWGNATGRDPQGVIGPSSPNPTLTTPALWSLLSHLGGVSVHPGPLKHLTTQPIQYVGTVLCLLGCLGQAAPATQPQFTLLWLS